MKNRVYIAGLPRSGTTLLSSILGQHPDIRQMGESVYTPMLNPHNHECSCGMMPCPISERIYEEVLKIFDVSSIHHCYGVIDKLREPHKVPHSLTIQENLSLNVDLNNLISRACDALESITNVYYKLFGDYIFLDNTKEILIAESLLTRQYWKVLLVIRDPRGVLFSTKKAGIRKGVPRPIEQKIPVLIEFIKKAKSLAKSSNVFLVKYENLCLYPEVTIKNICDFLDINYLPEMLSFKVNRGHTLSGNRMRLNHYDDKIKVDLEWKYKLSDDELNLINNNKELIKLYKSFGYFRKEVVI